MKNLKKLYQIIKSLRGLMLFLFGLSIIDTILSVVSPWIYRLVVNTASEVLQGVLTPQTAMANVNVIVVAAVGIFVVSNIVNISSAYYSLKLTVSIEKLVREKVFEHLSILSIEFFEKEKIGQVYSKINRGISRSSFFVYNLSTDVVASLLIGISSMFILFSRDKVIGTIVLISTVIFIISTRKMVKVLNPMTKK